MPDRTPPRSLLTLEKEVHLSDYLNILLRRWKIVAIVFALVFAGAAVKSFLTVPVFEAAATIQVRKASSQGNMMKELGMEAENSLSTEIQVLGSRSLAEKVLRRMNLDWRVAQVSPGLDVRIVEFTGSPAIAGLQVELTGPATFRVSDALGRPLGEGRSGRPLEAAGLRLLLEVASGKAGQTLVVERQSIEGLIGELFGSLQVAEVGKGSNMLRISLQGADQVQTRDLVNMLTEVYFESNVSTKTREAGKSVEFISQQLELLKGKLDSSEQELQEYKVQTGLVTLGPEEGGVVSRLVTLEQQKAESTLKRQRVEYAIGALQEALRNGSSFIPPVIDDVPQIAGAAQQLAELEATRKGMLTTFTPKHPAVVEKNAEIRRVHESLLSAYKSVRQGLLMGESDISRTMASYDERLKDIPETQLELAKRTRVHKVNAELYNFLLQKQQEAQIAQASTTSSAEIVDPALTPKSPVRPKRGRDLLMGMVLGLMLGIGLVFLLDYMDRSIKTTDDVRDKLGLAVYGIIPRIPFADEDARLPGKRLITSLAPKAPVVEAFRALRTNLQFITGKNEHQVIMVTSCLPSEGKSTVSGNLAVVLSQTGAKVLLVGCDLRRPSLYEMFIQSHEPGLTDLLVNEEQAAVRHLTSPKLDFIPAGRIPPNPAEILGSERMKKFLKTVRERYDYVVLDAPPVLPVTDAQVLGPLADVTIVVLEPCRVPERAALQMVAALRSVDVKIAGVVLNDKSGRGFKYYGNYGYYGNKYYRGYYGENEDDFKERPAIAAIKRVWEKLNS